MIKFRPLRADEIECRPQVVTAKGFSLLLYKDARCDMNVLDEVVGAENWQREHREYKGNLFCRLGINVNHDKKDAAPYWIWKEDCGAESNQDKEKGEASDSFKRAGFNWGIGRELYTAPFIWIAGRVKDSGKKTPKGEIIYIPDCKNEQILITRFEVVEGEHTKSIIAIEIAINKEVVFSWTASGGSKKLGTAPEKPDKAPTEKPAEKPPEKKPEPQKDGAKKMTLDDALNRTTAKGERFGDFSVEKLEWVVRNGKNDDTIAAAKMILESRGFYADTVFPDDDDLPF